MLGMYRTYELKGNEEFVIKHWDGDCTYYSVCETEDELKSEQERIKKIDEESKIMY